jgi:hypothetical protein
MAALNNPGVQGDWAFDPVVYASAGLNYSAVPALNQYQLFDHPDSAYVTGRINISAFADLGGPAPWPFANTAVPLNGHIRVPRGRGPFPLAVFAHGNHQPLQNSTPGYLYLCDLLASHGIVAATIDVNFLNGFIFGENDARAIVHLEHLKLFRTWNATAGHPLCGQIDLNRILIVGHSRGGEAVGHASAFNRLAAIQPHAGAPVVPLDGSRGLGPYRFALTGVAAIAPTDRQYEPVSGPTVVPDNYFLIHGSRDGDVSSFEGYNCYTRAHAVDPVNPTVSDGKFKSLLWMFRANHNQFNSAWPSSDPWPVATMTRAEQEQIARVHLGALSAALLLDRTEYLAVLRDHAEAGSWVPLRTLCVSQYQDPDRVFIQHQQEGTGPPQISSPVQGTVAADSVLAVRQLFDLVNAGRPQAITLRLTWALLDARLLLQVDPATLPADRYSTLVLRIGQSVDPANAVDRDQDLTIEVSSGSRTVAVRASSVHRLLYPDTGGVGAPKIVMQTLRLSLARIAELGIDLRDIRSIGLNFDQRATGVVYIGDLQLSK